MTSSPSGSYALEKCVFANWPPTSCQVTSWVWRLSKAMRTPSGGGVLVPDHAPAPLGDQVEAELGRRDEEDRVGRAHREVVHENGYANVDRARLDDVPGLAS